MSEQHLNDDRLAEFKRNGLLVLRSFFDIDQEILNIQRAIHGVIGVLRGKYGLADDNLEFSPATFDMSYYELLGRDRNIGSEVYDAIKQIPAFIRFCSHPHLADLTRQIRGTSLPGIAAGGYGIRIDNPNEEQFRANWHQDYTAQFRSLDGLVFWSPLLAVDEEMGPVQFCLGSHKRGPVRVYDFDPRQPEKTGAYALTLEDEIETIGTYDTVAPIAEPGDLVIIDYLTIHRSGFNVSSRSRWTMQIRYFNFLEASGIAHGWKGGTVAGVPINEVHPGLLIERSDV